MARASPSSSGDKAQTHTGQDTVPSQGHSHNYTLRLGQFTHTSSPTLHIFGMWEETGIPGEHSHRHRENMQALHRQPLPHPPPGGNWAAIFPINIIANDVIHAILVTLWSILVFPSKSILWRLLMLCSLILSLFHLKSRLDHRDNEIILFTLISKVVRH